MSKIPLAEQIEAFNSYRSCIDLQTPDSGAAHRDALIAIGRTLEWMQANEPDIRAYIKARARAKEHPAVRNVLEVFPEAQIEGIGEAD